MPQTDITHRPQKEWLKIVIDTPAANTEAIAAFLAELTGGGIELAEPPTTYTVNYERILAYLPIDANRNQKTQRLHSFLASCNKNAPSDSRVLCTEEHLLEQDWNSAWKEHFKPFHLTERLVIKPSWETYAPQPDEVVLEMDPGMAFGTGLHASTQLALQLIENIFLNSAQHASVLDVGTGTGILGMSSCLFGAESVIGLDNDIDARVAARANIAQNHLEAHMTVPDDDLTDLEDSFDIVIANITSDVLTLLSKLLYKRTTSGGHLVLSGILSGEQGDAVVQTFTALGLNLCQSQSKEEWIAFCFNRPASGPLS